MNLIDGEISLRQSLQRAGGELTLTATKTRRSKRRLALPKECVTALRAQRAQQNADRLAAGEKWANSDLVFTTHNGTPIEARDLNRAFTTLSKRAGIRQVRFHDLRHCSIRVTMDIYTFVRLDTQRAAFDRVGNALAGGADDGNDSAGAVVEA